MTEALFHAHYTSLVGAARLLLGDRGSAEEVVQEAYIRVCASPRRLRDPGAGAAYLRSVVLNLSRGRLRRQTVASRHEEPPPGRPGRDAADLVADRERQRAVVAALRTLPTRQRECVVLRYYLDLSERETADALGIAAGSVKSHLARAMTALRPLLEDQR